MSSATRDAVHNFSRPLRLLAGLLATSLVWACSCSAPDICRIAESAPVIFTGQVVEGGLTTADDPWNSDVGFARFRVITVFRGLPSSTKTIDVKFFNPQGMCSPIPFFRGETYLVVPSKRGTELFEGPCGASHDVNQRPEDVGYLRKYFAGTAKPAIAGRVTAMQRADLVGNSFAQAKAVIGVRITASANGKTYTAKTDERGNYQIPVPSNGPYQLTIEPQGYERVSRQADAKLEACGFENIVLQSKAVVIGTATTQDGAPLSRKTVFLIDAEHPADIPLEADTTASGSFEFQHVPLGRWLLSLRPGEYGGYPYEVTYSPGASSRANARVIEVTKQDQQERADVRQGAAFPLRKFSVSATLPDGTPLKNGGFRVELPESTWSAWQPILNGAAKFEAPTNRPIKIFYEDLQVDRRNGLYSIEFPPGTGPVEANLLVRE